MSPDQILVAIQCALGWTRRERMTSVVPAIAIRAARIPPVTSTSGKSPPPPVGL
jgi:hypothetical protein